MAEKQIKRRDFIKLSALGLTGLTILPSWTRNGVKVAPSDRINLGFIGVGRQGLSDFMSFSKCPGVQVVACSDVDALKAERFKRYAEKWQKENDMPTNCTKYEFYEDLLSRRDIDAVSIATPDHWHALNIIHACEAGKDIFCQKPLAYTVTEAIGAERAVLKHNRVLQVGSQQRSSKEFLKAIELVHSGAIGQITKVYAKVGAPPAPFDLKEEKVPNELNFNEWLGPLNNPIVHYNSGMCPPISLDPVKHEDRWGEWRWYRETGNGFIADWGAHMFDVAQWGLGMDGSAPVEYIPAGYDGHEYLTMKYTNGVVVTEQPYRDGVTSQGVKFFGTKGWIEVARGYLACSDPKLLDDQGTKKGVKEGEFEVSSPHMQNFLDCVKTREQPVAPIQVGRSTSVLCSLACIAIELERPVKWDPATNSFKGGDKEAQDHRLYRYEYRNQYKHRFL